MNKKYYDGGIVTEILFTHLEAEKMLEVLTAFAEAKGVDAVEVIRCKDCMNSDPWYADERRCFLWSENGISVFDDGFCNYAERKEE